MTKVRGHSGKRGGKIDKKSKKNVCRGRVQNQKMLCHSLTQKKKKKNFWVRRSSSWFFTSFAVFFMSVFVGDVISFLRNK